MDHDFYKGMPAELAALLDDPALEKELATFCVWQAIDDTEWHFAPYDAPEDGSDGIDTFLDYAHNLERHCEWFEEYYESELDAGIVQSIFEGNPITSVMIESLNPDMASQKIMKNLKENF